LRYQIRRFLYFSEQASHQARLEPRQHQLVLTLKGLPKGKRPRIGELAKRLQIQHQSAVELAHRLASGRCVRRHHGAEDRREVLLFLTTKGENILRELSLHHKAELRMRGPSLVAALNQPCTSAMAPRGSRPRLRQTAGEQAVMSERSNNGLSRPAQFRMVLVPFLAAGIGLIASGIAFMLYKLIGLFTNIFFYHHFAADFISARHNQLGPWVIPISRDWRNDCRHHGEICEARETRRVALDCEKGSPERSHGQTLPARLLSGESFGGLDPRRMAEWTDT
jgi:DNA-binding MarR family transcriptional regulator